MLILKLGGSVITRKDAEKPTPNTENLDRITKEVADALPAQLVIVHGAGSYGHIYAREYEIGSEIKDKEELNRKKMGYAKTHNSVKELNQKVCHNLLRHGVPAVSVEPSSFIISRNKRIESASLDIIKMYLDMGLVPVLHGDVVPDLNQKIKMAVISGDQIVKYIAEQIKTTRIILGSDVDGIYNCDPKSHINAKLLKKVRSLDDLEFLEGAKTVDVTGGMAGKLKELLEVARSGVESEIINANKPGLLERALLGEKVKGTIISK